MTKQDTRGDALSSLIGLTSTGTQPPITQAVEGPLMTLSFAMCQAGPEPLLAALPPSFAHSKTSSPALAQTYPVDELANHARPGAIGLRRPVQPILHQPQTVTEAQQLSQLPQHVHTEALKALIP